MSDHAEMNQPAGRRHIVIVIVGEDSPQKATRMNTVVRSLQVLVGLATPVLTILGHLGVW
jgi:hypothetical protein